MRVKKMKEAQALLAILLIPPTADPPISDATTTAYDGRAMTRQV
jgi:hypothetical protein